MSTSRLLISTFHRYLISLSFLFFIGSASATPLSGVLHLFDVAGNDACNNNPSCAPVTGNYDAAAGTLFFDPIFFYGSPLVASSVELLPVGTYVRSDGAGGTITATVNPGQVGAYVTFSWSTAPVLPTFMVWDVAGPESSQLFTPVDSDGDGIPGHEQAGGTFIGFSFIYEFRVGEPGPGVALSLDVAGGTSHECDSAGGAKVDFTANITLTGEAELDSITWTIDGNPAGSGNMISPTLELGSHSISATALTATGETDTKYVTVDVVDTTAPVLHTAFIDSRSGKRISEITLANVQWVKVHFTAKDACDAHPHTQGVGGFAVQNGDLLKIQGKNGSVNVTTSQIDLNATATDASGNTSNETVTLQILN